MTVIDFLTDVSPTTIIVVIAVCLVLSFLLWKDYRNLPPAPRFQLPIVGHMHFMNSDMRQTFRPLRKQLGEVYRLQLGSRMAIVIGGYDTIVEAFDTNSKVFAEGAKLYTFDAVTQNKGFINKSYDEWKRLRFHAVASLRTLYIGKHLLRNRTRIFSGAADLVEQFKSTGEKPFYPRPMVNTTVWNVIASWLFGDTVDHGEPLISNMLQMIEENMRNAPLAGVLNFFPFLRWLPGDIFRLKSCISNADKFHALSKDIVSKLAQQADTKPVDNLTSCYLKIMQYKATIVSLDNLIGTVLDLFIAGSETTTAAISWSIVCMVEYPDVQDKLYREIVGCYGKERSPSAADWPTFCNIVIAGFHGVSEDTQLLGYTIPKEALLLVDMDSIATYPDIWGDPKNFRPERFLDAEGHLIRNKEYFPFFLGQRSCVGWALAKMELSIILTSLVQKFEFVSPENEQLTVESVDGCYGLTHGPKQYEVVAKQRVSPSETERVAETDCIYTELIDTWLLVGGLNSETLPT